MEIRKHFDPGSLGVITVTFILFAVALVVKGMTHDLLLEAGVLLISIKLIMMAYKLSVTADESRARLDELIESYAERTNLPTDELDYYVVLARFKMACVLEGGYARFVKGGADNPKMESFGEVVLDMARRAAELARTTRL